MKKTDVQPAIVAYRLAQLKALKKRKRGAFNSKLVRYAEIVFLLKDEYKASYQTIAVYLWRHHRLKVSRENICYFYKKIKAEAVNTELTNDENFWGAAGEI